MQTAYISHPDCLKHDMGSYHPECSQRLVSIENQLQATGLSAQLQRYDAPLATVEQLACVHPQSYIASILQAAPVTGLIALDVDTAMNPFTLNAALRAAGAVVLATDLVLSGKMNNAFCAVRPPGHHAESDRAMGFCLFNNVAVGVTHAIQHYHLQRVAILDFDVHHGNGSEEIFRDNPHVMLCSTFQHPFYPYCGADSGSQRMINVPLPRGADGAVFRKAVTDIWLPALEQFKPEMIFVSAGFDAHRDDDMSQLQFDDDDYVWITQQIKAIANKYANGRIVSVLEGGYELQALGRCVAEHVRGLNAD
ncbi:acetoin utilization deacetylase AcuC-like enzyme [Nitrosomonas sp. Nm84]|uniref:histone deacetylase family protein n=1 Tax=Nitrosomonas sp. Nm84 TaxID=200124 RepID=UPI000D75F707|nr:histone deacetylase family protein [Nitrosomonas sp. Nm84]PXW88915.1 acetoin utilization deacetylase AcuC-like enzyme [Nitrosomonas sp. Nm84]